VNSLIKGLAGALVTTLLGVSAHIYFGTGTTFIAARQSDAQIAIGNAGAGTLVSVRFVTTPSLRRDALLSGAADAALRRDLLRAVSGVSGVRSARWENQTPLTSPPAAAQ
jgi:hypothetical protein